MSDIGCRHLALDCGIATYSLHLVSHTACKKEPLNWGGDFVSPLWLIYSTTGRIAQPDPSVNGSDVLWLRVAIYVVCSSSRCAC